MKNILLATKNPGKILEYRAIFKNYPLVLTTPDATGISDEPEEDGKTFEENAIKKAEFYSRFTDLPVLAEDSGLEVEYLNGAPGVHTRRWLGYRGGDEEILSYLLKNLEGVSWEKRGAIFKVVIAFKKHSEAKPLTFEGVLSGYITEEPKCAIIPGYPFRSVFYVEALGKCLGEIPMEEEALLAHRKTAVQKLLPHLFENA